MNTPASWLRQGLACLALAGPALAGLGPGAVQAAEPFTPPRAILTPATPAAPRPAPELSAETLRQLEALPFSDELVDEDFLLLDSLPATDTGGDATSELSLANTLPLPPLAMLLLCLGTLWRLEHRPH